MVFGAPRSIFNWFLLWLLQGDFKVSSGTIPWYRSSYGTDFDTSEIASPVIAEEAEKSWVQNPGMAINVSKGDNAWPKEQVMEAMCGTHKACIKWPPPNTSNRIRKCINNEVNRTSHYLHQPRT